MDTMKKSKRTTRKATTTREIPSDSCWYTKITPELVHQWPERFKGNVGKYFTLEATDHLDEYRVYAAATIRRELSFYASV